MKAKNFVAALLYVLSVLFFVFTVWTFLNIHQEFSGLVEQGFKVTKDNLYQVVSTYMANCATYFIGAVIFAALAYLTQNISVKANKVAQIQTEPLITEELDVALSGIDNIEIENTLQDNITTEISQEEVSSEEVSSEEDNSNESL